MKSKRKTLAQLFIMMIIGCVMMFGMSVSASASGLSAQELRDIVVSTGVSYQSSQAVSAASKILSAIKSVANVIGAISIVALAIMLFVGGNQSLQKAKGMAIGILVGCIVLSAGISVFNDLAGSSVG